MTRIVKLGVVALGALGMCGAASATDIVFENSQMRLTVGDDAIVKSLVVKTTGEECVPKAAKVPIFSVTQDRPFNNEVKLIHPNKRTTYSANKICREGNRLVVGFEIAPYEAAVDVKVTDSYVEFKLTDFLVDKEDYDYLKMDVPPVASFRVLQMPVKDRKYFGNWLNASWDESSAIGVVATSPYPDIDHEKRDGYRLLNADLVRGQKLRGASAALIVTGGREEFLDAMDQLECDFDLPRGVKSRRTDAINSFIYHLGNHADIKSIDQHIYWAKRGGFKYMTFNTQNFHRDTGSWGYHGDYDWNDKFPNGAADVKAMLKKVKDAGITPGLHFLHTHIGLKSRYVTPVADPRLNKTRRFTLARPLDDSTNTTEITVFEPTADVTMFKPCRVLQFGGELVSYEGYTKEPPYKFYGVRRGALNTRVTSHPRGEIGGILDISEFGNPMSCYLDQQSDLQEEVSKKIAAIYNCGFEYAYFDGSEGVNVPFNFHVSNAQYRQWKFFEPKPIFSEGAAKTHFDWHILTGANAFDCFTADLFKQNIIKFPVAQAPISWQDITRVNFGWWYYYGRAERKTGATTPVQWEFACSQCLAWDCPATVLVNMSEVEADKARAEACFEVMHRWSEAQQRHLLSKEQKVMLRDTSREFHLEIVDGKAVLTERKASDKPLFILNEDNDHYFKKDASEMTREALIKYVDNFARGNVTHFFMCPSGQRASFDSKTVEPIWLGIDETAETTTAMAKDGTHDRWALNAKKLFDAGIDPYEVWTKRCREKGVSPWFTIRMNDVHGMGKKGTKPRAQFRTTTFHRNRRDLWRDPNITDDCRSDDYWDYGQFDYANREVREYMLRHILEVASRWDLDGLELDWMRFGYSLKEGRERIDAHYITEFVARVREKLDELGKQRGRRIKLGCRVPRDLRSAKAVGLDVTAWLDGHFIDMLVPHSFLASDIELPVNEWLNIVAEHDPKVMVVPGLDICVGSTEKAQHEYMTPELYWGAVERFYEKGAKGVYFFNLPYLDQSDGVRVADTLYAEGIAPKTIAKKPREYLSAYQDFPSKGVPRKVPELMKTMDGRAVTDRETWEKVRKPEIKELFLREIYGKRPAEKPAKLEFVSAEPDQEVLNGLATRKRIRVDYADKGGASSFYLTAFLPKGASAAKPVPAFLVGFNRIPINEICPMERIVKRGYAAIAYRMSEVTADCSFDFTNDVFGVFQPASERTAESWGIISAWSWGASRVMDWIETEPALDAKHVAVVGQSRGGKTSLFTGVYDERFAMACVNNSGCGGAKLNHISLPLSEHFDQIWNMFGCWFCGNFAKYCYREHDAPFDAHWWAALMAPRLLAIASASEDAWAGPEGEFHTARLASPAWELYGKKGLVSEKFPAAGESLQEGSISYHLRPGAHKLTAYDWERYMDFADRHGWRGGATF